VKKTAGPVTTEVVKKRAGVTAEAETMEEDKRRR